jgi:hypothetical protein
MAIRLVLQKPAGTDVAIVEATNANGARVILNFLRWVAGPTETTVDRTIRRWNSLPEHIEGDPLLTIDADMDEAQLGVAFMKEIRRYVVKKGGQVNQEGIYATKRGEADTVIAANPVEWS